MCGLALRRPREHAREYLAGRYLQTPFRFQSPRIAERDGEGNRTFSGCKSIVAPHLVADGTTRQYKLRAVDLFRMAILLSTKFYEIMIDKK